MYEITLQICKDDATSAGEGTLQRVVILSSRDQMDICS